jgi:hypothetical protein
MFLRAFTDELVNGPCRQSITKMAGPAGLAERLIAAGALTGGAGHLIRKAHHGLTRGPYDPDLPGSTLGGAGYGAAGGGLLAMLMSLGSKGKVKPKPR